MTAQPPAPSGKEPEEWSTVMEREIDDGHITTHADVQRYMQREIDELRAEVERLRASIATIAKNIVSSPMRVVEESVAVGAALLRLDALQQKTVPDLQVEVERLREERDAAFKREINERDYKESAERKLAEAVALLNAVTCGEFDGIGCNDVNGKNWFDLRDEVTK